MKTLNEQIEESGIKELFKKWDDLMLYGEEVFHVDAEGKVRQVPVMNKEGQDILNRLNEERI